MQSDSFCARILSACVVTQLLLLAGCGLSADQRQAAATFSSSADAFGKLASDQFTVMRSGSSDLLLATYTRDVDAELPKKFTYDELLTSKKISTERVALRQKAAKALSDYAQAISALLNEDQSKNLETASSELATSLKSLPKDWKFVSDDDIDVLGKLIQQGGSILTDQMKADALRQIVPKYHRQVEHLCLLLGNDLSPQGGRMGSEYLRLSSNLYNHITRELDREAERIDKDPMLNAEQKAEKKRDARARLLPVVQLANEHRTRLTVLSNASAAGRKCAAASESLTKSLTQTSYSFADIENFAKEVENLYAGAKAWK